MGRPRKSEKTNSNDEKIPKKVTPVRAIRLKCLDCCANQVAEIKKCLCNDCPLYGFRMGRNPNYKERKGNPEAFKKFRENKNDFGENL